VVTVGLLFPIGLDERWGAMLMQEIEHFLFSDREEEGEIRCDEALIAEACYTVVTCVEIGNELIGVSDAFAVPAVCVSKSCHGGLDGKWAGSGQGSGVWRECVLASGGCDSVRR
jgi:hypothetical protein